MKEVYKNGYIECQQELSNDEKHVLDLMKYREAGYNEANINTWSVYKFEDNSIFVHTVDIYKIEYECNKDGELIRVTKYGIDGDILPTCMAVESSLFETTKTNSALANLYNKIYKKEI